MKRMVGTEEAARILGVTPRAIRKRFATGKMQGQFMDSGKGYGKTGQVLMVEIDDPLHPSVGTRKVFPGEPGRNIVTPLKDGKPIAVSSEFGVRSENSQTQLSTVDHTLTRDSAEPRPSSGEADAVPPPPTPLAKGREPLGGGTDLLTQTGCPQRAGISGETIRANISCDPLSPGQEEGRECVASTALAPDTHKREQDEHPAVPAGIGALDPCGDRPINPKMQRIANLRYALIQAVRDEIKKNSKPKTEIIRNFLDLYNSGLLLPEIHAEIKDISRSTLYNWLSAASPDDLVPQYGGRGQLKVTDHEKNLVLTLLLHQNRLKVAYAITLAKEYLIKKEIPSPSSPATLRRFIDQFRREHYDVWTLRREGEKALNDKVIPYAERDWRLLEVGDGLVADGHRLNFQVVHPVTGKPCRAALVLFWDWRSSYPLGWEIMVEENIQCVASALRNAIVALGKIPKWVLLDNGKAFRAKIFTEDISFEDTELPGMFARLNINYHFAQPYNAQAKPIERIFGILNEQLERLVPSYTGASIPDKPAWTKRNEKYAQSLHNSYVPTIPETNDLILSWRDRYAERPSRGRDGLRPIDIFEQGKGPGVDPNELIYLMMDREVRDIHRNGVTWLGWHWHDEKMYGLKDKVIIRYSLSDLSQIYVFHKNEFLCAAKPIEKVNPMASESDNPKDMEAVKEVIRLKKKVKNTTRKLCDLLETKTAAQIDWSRSRQPEISETIEKIEDQKRPKIVKISPFFDSNAAEPVKGADSGASIEEVPTQPEPRFKYAWERYDHLLARGNLNDNEKDWIQTYETGEIFPGEWEGIYSEKRIGQGGGNR
jgi:putative transposase